MKKSYFIAACCCLGIILSALLPWGIVLWGKSLIGRPFSLPAIPYRLSEGQAVESSDLEKVLILMAKGEQTATATIDPAEIDAFSLMDRVQEEMLALQNLGVLPAGEYSFPLPATSRQYSLPEIGTAVLWEFTAFFGDEAVRLWVHPSFGRVLALERTLPGEISSAILNVMQDGYQRYLAESGLPASVQFELEGNTILFSARYLQDT